MGKYILSLLLIILLGSILWLVQSYQFSDGKLRIVFCDVGQGDAIFLRTPQGSDILIDGGPNDSVLSCLSNHMPFWDRTIELVILTHPHADHLRGLQAVATRYTILNFYTENLANTAADYRKLIKTITQQHISITYMTAGDRLHTPDGVELSIVTPTKEFLLNSSPGGMIGESKEFASISTMVKYGTFKALLTGDTQAPELEEAIASGFVQKVAILQSPHHGSKTGLSSVILDSLNPKLAVISVGARNRYGHPHRETIELFRNRSVRVLRTDQYGEIEVISDGAAWRVKE